MANSREFFRQKHPKYTYCSSDQTACSRRIEATALNRHAWKDNSLFCSPLEQLVHRGGRKRIFVENTFFPFSYKKNLPIRPPLSLGSARVNRRIRKCLLPWSAGKKIFIQCFGAHVYLAKTDAGVLPNILCRTDASLGIPIPRDTQPVSNGNKNRLCSKTCGIDKIFKFKYNHFD